MKTRILPVVLLLAAFTSPWVQAQAAKEKLSRERFIEMLKASHPSFLSEQMNLRIAAQEKQIQAAGQDWELQMTASQGQQQFLLPDFGPDKVDQSKVGVGLARPIWRSGAFVSLDAEAWQDRNNYQDSQNSPFSTPDKSTQQQLSVTFSQPLLRNYGGKQNRLAFDLSEKNELLTALQVKETQEQFLHAMLDSYLDWVALQEEMQINERRLALSRQQGDEIKKRFAARFVEQIDMLRAEDATRLAEQQYLLSRSRFSAQSERLALVSAYPELLNMQPDFNLYDFPELPALEELRARVKKHSRNLAMIDQNIAQQERQLESISDNKKPELNLDLRAAVKSEEQDGLAAGMDNKDDGQDFSIGLNFRKLLGNSAANSEVAKLHYRIEQLRLERQYTQMDLDASIVNLHIQLKEMQNILRLNKNIIDTAERTTQEEERVYRQGRSDLTNVISSRDRVQNSRLQYAQNAASYHRLYFQLLSLSDQLLSTSDSRE